MLKAGIRKTAIIQDSPASEVSNFEIMPAETITLSRFRRAIRFASKLWQVHGSHKRGPMTVRERFLDGMSNTACTVCVVTTDGAAGRHGATVSAMASVSDDTPEPTLLICINQTSATAQAIKTSGVFCVNILRDSQSDISDCFAKRWKTQDGDKFSHGNWVTDSNGSPRVSDGLVAFGCILSSWQKVGTHYIFFGAVQEVTLAEAGSPLLYANRSYGSAVAINAKR